MHRSRVCHFVIDVPDLGQGVLFWPAALGATEQHVPERGRHIYRKLRLPGSGIQILLQLTSGEKVSKERMHLDLETGNLEAKVQRLEALGAKRCDLHDERGFQVLGAPRPLGQRVLRAAARVSRAADPARTVARLIDWRQLLSAADGYELRSGADSGDVTAAERALEAVFPADFRGLYLVSDGVFDAPGQWFVIWPLAEVVTRNLEAWAREGSPARRALTGFGDGGTGTPFCVPRDGGDGVFAWSTINGETTRLANGVAAFWSGWVAGTLPPH